MKPARLGHLLFAIICILVALGVWSRFDELGTHFAHVDDVGVAFSILNRDELNIARIRSVIYDNSRPSHTGQMPKLLRRLDDFGVLEWAYHVAQPAWRSFVVPLQWTYAPLQFFVTQHLISDEQEYSQILFWGRFPSAVFASMSIFILAATLRALYGRNWPFIALLPLSILCLSWQNIIYAKQMENYSLGVTAVLALIAGISWLQSRRFDRRQMRWSALAVCIALTATYQILFFLPAVMFVAVVLALRDSVERPMRRMTELMVHFAAPIVVFLVPIYVLFLSHRKGAAISWNAGPNREYVFEWPAQSSFLDLPGRAFTFLRTAGMDTVEALIAFAPEQELSVRVLAIAILLLAALGIVTAMRDEERRKNCVILFGVFGLATYCTLFLAGILTLSPTRHSMILLPLILVLAAEGISVLANHVLGTKECQGVAWSAVVLLIGVVALQTERFAANYVQIIEERRDIFQQVGVEEKLKAAGVGMILSDSITYHARLMQYFRGRAAMFFERRGWIDVNAVNTDARIAFLSSREALPIGRQHELLAAAISAAPRESRIAEIQDAQLIEVSRLELRANVQVDFSRKTINGGNELYLYIVEARNRGS